MCSAKEYSVLLRVDFPVKNIFLVRQDSIGNMDFMSDKVPEDGGPTNTINSGVCGSTTGAGLLLSTRFSCNYARIYNMNVDTE